MSPSRPWKFGITAAAAGALVFALPSAASASGTDALAPLVNADSANAVEGSYVVVLDGSGAAEAATAAAGDVEAAGGEVTHRYSEAINGFAATLTSSELAEVRSNPDVAYVEVDQVMRASETQSPTPSWGLDRTDQVDLPLDDSYTYGTTGSGVNAYVIDTGIYSGHSDFGDRVSSGYDAINDGNGTEDCQGHGTHVAGTIAGSSYGLAKEASLHAVRVLGCDGSGTTAGVIAGVDWVAQNHQSPAVGNMSLGGGASQALDDAVSGAVSAGVTMAVAAGNDSGADACGSSPARAETALTVASSDSSDAQSSFSNVGPCVDLYAPGSDITSAWIGGADAENTISGTSMATPHVAGVAALYLAGNGSATPADVGEAITGAATPDALSGVPSGTANLLLHYPQDWSGGNPDPDPDPEPTGCEESATTTVGALDGAGAESVQPEAGSFDAAAGTISGCLAGPAGADFDLYLQVQDGSNWSTVDSSLGWDAAESVEYEATAGTYRFVVRSYSGEGEFTFGLTTP